MVVVDAVCHVFFLVLSWPCDRIRIIIDIKMSVRMFEYRRAKRLADHRHRIIFKLIL